MEEMTINERAKRGIPSLALTEWKDRLDEHEGFDNHGYFWYRYDSQRMRPEIESGAYLLLEKVPSPDDIRGINGAIYVLCLKWGKTDSDITTGRALNNAADSDRVLLATTYPERSVKEIPKDIIVEAYRVAWVMERKPK